MHDGVFNNAYVLAATGDSEASRGRIAEFNKNFITWYGEVRPDPTALHRPELLPCTPVAAPLLLSMLAVPPVSRLIVCWVARRGRCCAVGASGADSAIHGGRDEPGAASRDLISSDLRGRCKDGRHFAVYTHKNIAQKAGPFSAARLQMGLPFYIVSCSERRSARSPHAGARLLTPDLGLRMKFQLNVLQTILVQNLMSLSCDCLVQEEPEL